LIEQVTSSVRWEESMRYLVAQGLTRFIELGPGAALTGFLKRIEKTAQPSQHRRYYELETTVQALSS